jgi:hypothetical protein
LSAKKNKARIGNRIADIRERVPIVQAAHAMGHYIDPFCTLFLQDFDYIIIEFNGSSFYTGCPGDVRMINGKGMFDDVGEKTFKKA